MLSRMSSTSGICVGLILGSFEIAADLGKTETRRLAPIRLIKSLGTRNGRSGHRVGASIEGMPQGACQWELAVDEYGMRTLVAVA